MQDKKKYFLKFQGFLKEVLDRCVALACLIALIPILILIATIIYLNMGSPVIFAHPRPGKEGNIFTFYKFRTMTQERNAQGQLLSDDQRLTRMGKLLRLSSLDELPQLWNIVLGDMSFVGPRPLIVAYLDRYNSQQARRHEVKPGITGLAQVNGRNLITWEEKFRLDVWYIDHWSLWLDFKILGLTIWKVLQREGISQEGFATSEEFKGQSEEK